MSAFDGQADPTGLTVVLLARERPREGDRVRARALEALAPLLTAHRAHRPLRIIDVPARALVQRGWSWIASGSAAVIALPIDDDAGELEWPSPAAPFIRLEDGRAVPIGWLASSLLPGAVRAAVQSVARPGSTPGPVVLLGPGRGRTAAAFDEIEANWPGSAIAAPPHRWTSDRVGWEDLRPGLAAGLGCAVYMGHASAEWWHAYGGVTPERLADSVLAPGTTRDAGGRPIGVLIALTCDGAGSTRIGEESTDVPVPDSGSFAARTVALGAAAAVIAAVGAVDHSVNREVAGLVASSIADGCTTLADIVAHAARDAERGGYLSAFRIIGDPLARIAGDPSARTRIDGVPATDVQANPPPMNARWPSLAAIR